MVDAACSMECAICHQTLNTTSFYDHVVSEDCVAINSQEELEEEEELEQQEEEVPEQEEAEPEVELIQLKHGHKVSKDDYTLCLEDEESPNRRLHRHKESTQDRVIFTQETTQEKNKDLSSNKRTSTNSRTYELPVKVSDTHFRQGLSDITKEQENASNQYQLTES